MIMTWKYLLKKEFLQFLRDPGMPRMVMMFPLIIVLVFPFAATMEVKNIKLSVVDCDRSEESAMLVEKCTSTGYFQLAEMSSTPQRAQELMDFGKVDAILTINAGFARYMGEDSSQG